MDLDPQRHTGPARKLAQASVALERRVEALEDTLEGTEAVEVSRRTDRAVDALESAIEDVGTLPHRLDELESRLSAIESAVDDLHEG